MNRRDRETLAAQIGLYAERVTVAGSGEYRHTGTEFHETLERFMGVEMTSWQRAVADAAMTGRASLWIRPRSSGAGVIAEWVAELEHRRAAGRMATVDAVRTWRDETRRMPTPVTSPRAPQGWTDAVATRTGGAP